MARRIPEEDLREIEQVVRQHPGGLTAQQIDDAVSSALPRRTLQYRLRLLVDCERLVMEGTGRRARYRAPRVISVAAELAGSPGTLRATIEVLPALSDPGATIRQHVHRPPPSRTPVGYDQEFFHAYRPNETFYLSEAERESARSSEGAWIRNTPPLTWAPGQRDTSTHRTGNGFAKSPRESC